MKKMEVKTRRANNMKALLVIIAIIGIFILTAQITVKATTNMNLVNTSTVEKVENPEPALKDVENVQNEDKITDNEDEAYEVPFGISEDEFVNYKADRNEEDIYEEVMQEMT